MIIALDQALADWLDERGVAYYKKVRRLSAPSPPHLSWVQLGGR